MINLTTAQAHRLRRELDRLPVDTEIEAVRSKLESALGPNAPAVIPGQTTIDEHLEAA